VRRPLRAKSSRAPRSRGSGSTGDWLTGSARQVGRHPTLAPLSRCTDTLTTARKYRQPAPATRSRASHRSRRGPTRPEPPPATQPTRRRAPRRAPGPRRPQPGHARAAAPAPRRPGPDPSPHRPTGVAGGREQVPLSGMVSLLAPEPEPGSRALPECGRENPPACCWRSGGRVLPNILPRTAVAHAGPPYAAADSGR
jgi:hypothetical protein